ncbi:hypothetical protein ACQYRI_09375 [Salmonella enterica]
MKKGILLLLLCILTLIGAYSLMDIIQSISNVMRYESFTWAASGTILGKILFLIVVVAGIALSLKLNRKN